MRLYETASFVPRERLRYRLEAAALRPVTLLVAPAGCGKSVALHQFLSASGEPHVRYDVQPDNDTLLGFVRGFADALRSIAPSARGGVAEAVQAASAKQEPGRVLAAWMSVHMPPYDGTIAIDDLHICLNDAQCALFLSELIERTKHTTNWILASRSSMHLPEGSWLAQGDATVAIGETELQFTTEEAQNVARSIGTPLGSDEVRHLHEMTSGWATGLTLALRVSEFAPNVQHAAMAARDLSYRYLAEHIYRSLSDEERELLAFCSVLPTIEVAVLERAGFERARTVLDGLRTRYQIVTPQAQGLDAGSARAYRCHDLFRDYLSHELELTGESRANAVRLRAADALVECGNPVAALRLYTLARSRDHILELLALHGFVIDQQAHGDTMACAIAALPETDRENDAIVLGLRGQQELMSGHYTRAEALFERAYEAAPTTELSATLLVRLTVCHVNLGKPALPALEPLAAQPGLPASLRGELLSLVAIARARAGALEQLPALLDEVESIAAGIERDQTRSAVLQRIGVAGFYAGDVERGRRVLPEAARLARSCGMYRAATFTSMALGASVLLDGANPLEARGYMFDAMEAASKSGEDHHRLVAMIGMLDVQFFLGEDDEMRRLLALCEAAVESAQLDRGSMLKTRATLAALSGDFATAATAMGQACDSPHFNEYPLLGRACYALFSAAADRKRETLDAIAAIDDLLDHPRASKPAQLRFAKIACAFAAIAAALVGRLTVADRLLLRPCPNYSAAGDAAQAAAMSIVEGIKLRTPPASLRGALSDLHALSHGTFATLLEKIVATVAPFDHEPVALTAAETSVLRALAAGQTPKEIALTTQCSVNTVRWHIRRTIEKFGCSGSDQAVRLAQARNLI